MARPSSTSTPPSSSPTAFARLWLRDQLPFRAPLLEMPTERTSLSLEHQICLVAAANACDFLAPFESANANTAAARISTVVADDVAPLTAVSRALDGSGDGHALSPRGPAGTGSVDSQIVGWHAASGPVQSERGDTYDSYPPATAWEEGHPDGFWTAAHNPLGHGMDRTATRPTSSGATRARRRASTRGASASPARSPTPTRRR